MMDARSLGGHPPTSRKTRLTAVIVACALFMQNLDGTVIATALPSMARAFAVDPVSMNVALTSYLLAVTLFIPASGWMADRYGTRTVFRAAIAVFTLGSVLCGRAESLPFLVAARILQGIGGAMMVPVGRLVLLRTAPKSELVSAMAWLTMPALIGPVLGPPIGGLIVTYASWRWIFDINVPIGLIGIGLVTAYVEDVREPQPGRLDLHGFFLIGIALTGFVLGLEGAGRGTLSRTTIAACFGAGALASALYALHARRHPRPLLDFSLMRQQTFAVSVIAGTAFRIGVGAIPFLLPMLFQVGFGDTAARSGSITFASAAGAFAMKPITRTLIDWIGFRNTLLWNGALSALGIAAMAAFRPGWPIVAIYLILLVAGSFRSLQFTAFNTIAYADVPRSRMSAATSLYTTIQQLAQVLGISAGAAALSGAMSVRNHAEPSIGDFSAAFLAVAVLALLAVPLCWRLAADAGAGLTTRRPAAAP